MAIQTKFELRVELDQGFSNYGLQKKVWGHKTNWFSVLCVMKL